MNDTYNGYTNYETWLIYSMYFCGDELEAFVEACVNRKGAEDCRNYIEEIVTLGDSRGIDDPAVGLAFRFLSNVDWMQIAQKVNDTQ